jgi:hypothetical protein
VPLFRAIAVILLAKAPKFIDEVMSCRPRKCQDQQFGSAEACFQQPRDTPEERVCLAGPRSGEGAKTRRFIRSELATRPFKIVIPRQAITPVLSES